MMQIGHLPTYRILILTYLGSLSIMLSFRIQIHMALLENNIIFSIERV